MHRELFFFLMQNQHEWYEVSEGLYMPAAIFFLKRSMTLLRIPVGMGMFLYTHGVCTMVGILMGGCEVFVMETSMLVFCPGKGHLIDFEDVVSELEFLWPEEVIPVNVKIIQPVPSEAHAGSEQGWMSWEQMEGEEGVLGVVLDDSEVLWEGCRDRVDFLGYFLVDKGR